MTETIEGGGFLIKHSPMTKQRMGLLHDNTATTGYKVIVNAKESNLASSLETSLQGTSEYTTQSAHYPFRPLSQIDQIQGIPLAAEILWNLFWTGHLATQANLELGSAIKLCFAPVMDVWVCHFIISILEVQKERGRERGLDLPTNSNPHTVTHRVEM